MANQRSPIATDNDAAPADLQAKIYTDFASNENFLYSTLRLLIHHMEGDHGKPELDLTAITRSLDDLHRQLSYVYRRVEEIRLRTDLYHNDTLLILNRLKPLGNTSTYTVETENVIAIDSDDHRFPYGTAQDNTRCHRFVAKCAAMFPAGVRFLDLGCAGGGLVLDFVLAGHRAVGLEGSDYSLRTQRAAWRLIPNHLHTCDIARPFEIHASSADELERFDVISAWEVLEHIDCDRLPQLLTNVRHHLSESGIFVGSINFLPDGDRASGAQYHVTLHDRDWWFHLFHENGLDVCDQHQFEPYDYPRGTRNGLFDSSDYNTQPNRGCHFVLKAVEGSK